LGIRTFWVPNPPLPPGPPSPSTVLKVVGVAGISGVQITNETEDGVYYPPPLWFCAIDMGEKEREMKFLSRLMI